MSTRVPAIVTTSYRYKRPPRKRKAVALEAPAIRHSEKQPPPHRDERGGAEASEPPAITTTGQRAQPSTPRETARVAPPANDDRKTAIVTVRRRGKRFFDAPDLTPEELQRRGEAASAMWSRLVGRATAKDGKSAAVYSVSAGLSSPATKPAIVTTGRKRRRRRSAPTDGVAAVPQAGRARRGRLRAAEGRDGTTTAQRRRMMRIVRTGKGCKCQRP